MTSRTAERVAGAIPLWRRWIPSPKAIVITLVLIAVIYLALVPLWYMLWTTLFDATGFSFSGFERAYGDGQIFELVGNSLQFAVGTTVLSLVLGTAMAYVYTRTDAPFKGLLLATASIPLIIPGILYTIAWIFLASPQIGLVNKAIEPVLGPGFFNIFSVWGMVWVEGLHVAPLVFLMMTAAFRSMDPSLEESAQISGASQATVIRRIVLPLMRPAILGVVVIVLVRALESFEVPALLGVPDNIYLFTNRIFYVLTSYPADYAAAGALAVGLLVFALVGVWLSSLATGSGRRYQTVSGKAFRPRQMRLGKWRMVTGAGILGTFLVAVAAPVGVLLYASLIPEYLPPSLEVIKRVTVSNYQAIFADSQTLNSLKNSIVLGILSATIIMVVMAFVAFIIMRTRVPGRKLLEHITMVPLVIPGLVMGMAIAFVYLRSPIPIYGTIWILVVAYVTRYMPYGMRYAMTSLQQISVELEESAAVSGASWLKTFRRVVLPLMMPGVIAGWTYILIVSFRELSSSILLYSPGSEVVAVTMFQQYNNGEFTAAAALGIFMIVILTVLILIGQKVGGRLGIRLD